MLLINHVCADDPPWSAIAVLLLLRNPNGVGAGAISLEELHSNQAGPDYNHAIDNFKITKRKSLYGPVPKAIVLYKMGMVLLGMG